jgi:hypothetical protein
LGEDGAREDVITVEFRRRTDRNVWGAWTGLGGRSLKPEVLAAIEKILAGKARVVPPKLLRVVPTLDLVLQAPDDLDDLDDLD